jgi:hypothetical protein
MMTRVWAFRVGTLFSCPFHYVRHINPAGNEVSQLAIFRVEKTRDYTVMANHHLKNRSLSLKAKGLLSQMLSLPEDWDYTLKGLSMINRESVDAIREAIRELELARYIARTRERNDKGHLKGSDYTIFERPQFVGENADIERPVDIKTASDKPAWNIPTLENPTLDNPTLDFPAQDKPMLDFPTLENPTQLNTNRTNTKLPSKNLPNTNQEKTNQSNPHQSISLSSSILYAEEEGWDGNGYDDAASLRNRIRKNIEYDYIIPRFSQDRLDEIVDLIVETLCSRKPYIIVAGDEYPASLVKDKLLRLNSSHIEYVIECLDKNTTYIRNIKKYLLTTLFNAPTTIDSYYAAMANHDIRWNGAS